METRVAGETVKFVAPLIPAAAAVIDAVPTALVVPWPTALMLTIPGAELDHEAVLVRSTVLPSV